VGFGQRGKEVIVAKEVSSSKRDRVVKDKSFSNRSRRRQSVGPGS